MIPNGNDKAQRRLESQAFREKGPIAAEFEDCQQSFVQLSDALSHNRLRHLVDKCWRRFDLWDDDSGASSRTLDYTLKSSSSLIKQTISLLHNLSWTLGQAILAVPLGELDSGESGGLALSRLQDDGVAIPGDADTYVDFGPEPWLHEAFDIVYNLVYLLPVLRSPFEKSALPDATLRLCDNNQHVLESYREAAAEMFPAANADLLDRLAQSRWLVRNTTPTAHGSRLEKLNSSKTATVSQAPTRPLDWTLRFKSSKIHSFHRTGSDDEISTIRSHVDTVWSRTAMADHYSTTSLGGSSQTQIVPRPEVPNPPVDLDQLGADQFDCPYCHFELPFAVGTGMNYLEWASHFYQDMKPYICTLSDTRCRDVQFASREEWFHHELDFHRTTPLWMCALCATGFDDEDKFTNHLRITHVDITLPRDLSLFVESCKRLSHVVNAPLECALCHAVCRSLEELENHLGNHMEEFAIETAHEYEPPMGTSQENDANRSMVLRDFLSDEDSFSQPEAVNFVDFDKNENGSLSNAAADAVNRYFERQPETSKTKQHNLPTQYKNFAGRDQDLHSIDELLSSAARICLLTGVSGIGKTATAVQYAYRFGAEYSYVFWVEAEAPGLLADKYATIAEALDLSRDDGQDDNNIIFRVRETLMKLEKKWLLIFDNATTWTDISPYVTQALTLSKGSVLITTKENPFPAAPNWLRQRHVKLGPLSIDHGREFLLTSIHPRVRIEDLHEDEDYEFAAKTIRILNGLPLAISMVVGYVKESGCTLEDFLEMWDEKESRSKKPGKTGNAVGSSVDNTVDSLWDIGIREVPSNSRKLLNIMSFLNADKIPKSLLVGDHEEDYLDFLNASEVLGYKRMINKLSSRRLISWKEAPTGEIEYSIHRILQEKIMADMDDYSIADAFRKTFRLLRKRFPRADHQQVPNPSNWGACQAYMPHIESFHQTFCREQDRIESLAGVKTLDLAELFYDAGFHIWSRRGTLYNGLTLLETAVSLLDSMQYDRDSKLRADINCMLGLLRLEMSCEERAEGGHDLLEARRIREVISRQRPDHHDTDVLHMNAISDYALCLLNDHKFDEAGEEMRKCFERYKIWGPESDNPFENSKFYGNYSIVLMFQGKMDEAIRSVRNCLDLTLRFSGKKAQFYRRRFLLASIYLQVGELQQALDLHLETLQARLEMDGKYDAAFILSLYAVGAMYHHLNNVEEATLYMKQCVDCATSTRWSDVGLARAQLFLAILYDEKNIEGEKAQQLKTEARKVLNKYRSYAAECVQGSDNELMILDDLQPTLLGRYTGTALLKHLQAHLPRS